MLSVANKPIMLSGLILNVLMLGAIMLSAVVTLKLDPGMF
jgi:hypothetical protein